MARPTRGQRNHNPLNIRKSCDTFQGELPPHEQTDAQFKQFKSDTWGLRAAFRILHGYNTRHHLFTVEELISRWAPPLENLTRKYINDVCTMTKLKPRQIVEIRNNRFDAINLVRAMAQIESNMKIDIDTLTYAFGLAFVDDDGV